MKDLDFRGNILSGTKYRVSPVRGESRGRDEQPGWTNAPWSIAMAMNTTDFLPLPFGLASLI